MLTGQYLSGRKTIETPAHRRAVDPEHVLEIENARANNLKHLDVTVPLGMIVTVTGVSGSGKSTLVKDVLYTGLRRLKGVFDEDAKVGAHDGLRGANLVDAVEMVDQTPIGKTPPLQPGQLHQGVGRHPRRSSPTPPPPSCAATSPPRSRSTCPAGAARPARARAR